MSAFQYITIRAPHSNQEVDLEVPADEPISAFLPDLIKVINWPEFLGGESVAYQLSTESDHLLDARRSLTDLKVDNFEILWLSMQTEGAPPAKSASEPEPLPEGASHHELPAPPSYAGLPIDAPSLVSSQGYVFVLGSPPLTIGRRTRATAPDIDLSELDNKLLCSRRHAQIMREKEDYLLQALQTTNGTFVNGSELPPGEKIVLKPGDAILFGFRGVELVFQLPS